MGYSNGATTALVSMTSQENDHRQHFAAAFAVAPGCSPSLQPSAVYTGPIIVFMGDQDDANNPEWCRELAKRKRSVPVQMIEYQGANHGFPVNAPAHDFMGWHLSYSPAATRNGIWRGILISPPAAAASPRFTSGIPNLALRFATIMSHANAISIPPASA
jgi:dienelactone hydrolase